MSDGGTEILFLSPRAAAARARCCRACSSARSSAAGAPSCRRASEERVEALDTLLWTYREESFLPHGTTRDGDLAACSPIYLTTGEENPNGAQVRFLVDGAELDDASPYTRVVYLFDGRDAARAWPGARGSGKAAKDDGYDVTYWQQDPEGRWQKKA